MAESAGKIYSMAVVLSLLAIAASVLRFHARRVKQAALSWDDYMILPAMLFAIGTAACMVIGAAVGDLGQHTAQHTLTKDGQEIAMPVFDYRLRVFEQMFFAIQLTQTLTFGFTKLSVLLFYKRIFKGTFVNTSAWTMIAVTIVWTVAFLFANMFQCWPFWINWTAFGATKENCININTMFRAQAYSDVFTDVLILSLPLPCIWAMQLQTKQKIAISGIFLLGGLTVGAGIAKLVVFNQVLWQLQDTNVLDVSYIQTPMVYWPMVESSLGIVGACLPLLRPLFVGASSIGFMRRLKSVKVLSLDLNEDALKQLGDGSPRDSSPWRLSFSKFGSDTTVVPSEAQYTFRHHLQPKVYRMESVDSLRYATKESAPVYRFRRADDYVRPLPEFCDV